MKKSILFSVIAMIALASCQQKEDFTLPVEGELMTFYASIMDDATKTTAELDQENNQTKVLWAEGDAYAMSVKGGAFAEFTLDGEGGETTGTFSGTAVDGGGTQNIAYYPYAESGISLSEDKDKLNVVFPAKQAYTVGCIAAAPMVAVSADNTLKFQNVASLIKITIRGDKTIKSVSLTGNNDESLAGNAVVTLGETPSLALAADAEGKTITLDCGEGIQLTTDGVDFYFAVPSITLTKGFTVVATDSEEKAMIKSTTKEVALTASKVKVFPEFEYESNVEEVSNLDELKSALSNTGIASIKLTGNLTTNETLTINRTIILNGDGKTLTYTGTNRAFQITGGTVVINDLTVDMSEDTPEGSRGINLYNGDTNLAIDVTLNNVTINGYKAYAVNIGGGKDNKLTINKSALTGYAAINVHVASVNHTIVVDGSTLNGKNHNNNYHFGTVVVDGTNAHSLTITESHITTENIEGVTSKYYPVVVGANCTYNVNEGIDVAVRNVINETDGLYYIGLKGAVNKGGNIKLLANIELEDMITIPSGKTVTIDLNGKTIIGTDNAISSFGLITLDPGSNLTINSTGTEGNIKLRAVNNRGWNAYSSVISNQRATLTVGENVVIEHLGGTDMAYGVDNLTNTGAEHAKTTIEGATIKSTYRAIRQFLNSTAVGVNNVLHVKSGIIEGVNKSIWMQNANANANPGKLIVEANAQLKGDVQLSASNAEVWAVEVSIAAKALIEGSEVLPSNVKEGYEIVLNNGNYVVKKVVTKTAATLAELETALNDAGAAGAGYSTIYITADIDMTGQTWTPIKIDGYNGADIVTVEGNGHTIKGLTAGLFEGGFAGGSGIVIKNLTIEESTIVANDTQGYGAFVGCADSMDEITLINCHLKNSSIITPNDGADESRIGGLIGWTAGYNNQNDGPVDSYITVKECSVTDCTLKGAGSIGGIVGHAGANAATFTTIENCTVRGNTFTSTDNGGWRVGVVVGTANNGQCVIKGITASDNALSQKGKTAPEGQSNLYGRFVPAGTGTLVIDGTAVTNN